MLVLASLELLFPIHVFAAAQLAAGAKTSAQPTSTNPQQRQLQITFDPAVVPADETPSTPDYNVTSFQLSVSYDSTKLTFLGVDFIDPYAPTLIKFTTPGEITLGGSAPFGMTEPGDVNLFLINFKLKDTITLDDTLHITIFADSSQGDFITGTPKLGDPLTTQDGIQETALVGSLNQFTAELAAPTPSVLPAGGCLLGVLATWRLVASRRRSVAK
jgi:hypothetical protein